MERLKRAWRLNAGHPRIGGHMDILLCLIKTVGGWVALMLIGTNLLGMVVRGLVAAPGMDQLEAEMPQPVRDEVAKAKLANVGITLFSALLGVLYLYLLLRFWNLGVLAIAVMLMLSRLPDLLWEIRTGQKVNLYRLRSGAAPKGAVTILATVMMWAALPLLWFFLC
jgi:hypothetical protein